MSVTKQKLVIMEQQQNSSNYKNIQDAVNELLNVGSYIKRQRKRKEDKQKDLFIQSINMLEDIISRSKLIYSDFELDMSAYEERFYLVIESLMYMYFGKDVFELLSFYLWERLDENGSVTPILDEHDNEYYIESANQLWDIIVRMNPKLIK